jgi:hypothetical protein
VGSHFVGTGAVYRGRLLIVEAVKVSKSVVHKNLQKAPAEKPRKQRIDLTILKILPTPLFHVRQII